MEPRRSTRVRKNPFGAEPGTESESKRPAAEAPDCLTVMRTLANLPVLDVPDAEPAPVPEPSPKVRTVIFDQGCDPRYGEPKATLVTPEEDELYGGYERELGEAGLTLVRLWEVNHPWVDRRFYDCLRRDEHFSMPFNVVETLWHLPGYVNGVGARGLTTKFANPKGCLGAGIYASTADKAAEYRDKQREPLSREEGDPPGLFTLAVVEVNLGKARLSLSSFSTALFTTTSTGV